MKWIGSDVLDEWINLSKPNFWMQCFWRRTPQTASWSEVNDTDYLVAVAFVKLRDVYGSMWTVTFLKRKCWKNGQHKNQFDMSQAVLAAQFFTVSPKRKVLWRVSSIQWLVQEAVQGKTASELLTGSWVPSTHWLWHKLLKTLMLAKICSVT